MNDLDLGLFSTPAMVACFSTEEHVRQMLRFEAALARAGARAGVLPIDDARSITSAADPAGIDLAALLRDALRAGTVAIPLVRLLTDRVGPGAARFVHWGATSQDVIDSALMLQMQTGIQILHQDLRALGNDCARLAGEHRGTIMAGRTLLQQAVPISFGLKAARWLALVCRQIEALRAIESGALALQFGGAAGTRAALGERADLIASYLAEELGLANPVLPWHTERDRIGDIAGMLGVLSASLAKIAQDIVLLAQTEVGEVREGAGEGKAGSSTMPQKRNPMDASLALAAARLAIGQVPIILSAMIQEHERATGGWQTEWPAVPSIFQFSAGTLVRVREAVAGLEINVHRMAENLRISHGAVMSESLLMALAEQVGRDQAFSLVQRLTNRLSDGNQHLEDLAAADPDVSSLLTPGARKWAFEPLRYLGMSNQFIDRALDAFSRL